MYNLYIYNLSIYIYVYTKTILTHTVIRSFFPIDSPGTFPVWAPGPSSHWPPSGSSPAQASRQKKRHGNGWSMDIRKSYDILMIPTHTHTHTYIYTYVYTYV